MWFWIVMTGCKDDDEDDNDDEAWHLLLIDDVE